MEDTYKCRNCGSQHRGVPAGMVPRGTGGRRVPVCHECLPAYMPPRHELEQFWLRCMKASAAR
jgi:hypothetical protein